ncbi:G-type lectin S-receptor-like serine/threonine-protein kinase At1g11300 isoform X2 [Vitis riparia]|uniref:G-type lectin S-receptor-like serine/threonine-protein kinase At1g11300 isoform X2 n=1 Tax=Vitis riparia TaxID=96939 RepID=UPI00155B1768|nr:G-type lectin S-receptor-like serine/threonine-protein kinase At1g11300 isoform X2 [Vitis riparia]
MQGWINLRDATLSTFPFIAHQMESISSPTRSIEAAMDIISGTSVTALLLLLSCLCFQFCTATNTITSAQFIKDPEIMVSNGSLFKMGFFSPDNSTKRYFGIWYNTTSLFTVIWISNRENPLNDSSGIVMVSEDGNLLVLNGQKDIFWSSNVSNAAPNSSAQLLDSGNLVLQDKNSGRITWQSFQHPSHAFLQKMQLSENMKTGEKKALTSWKSPSDPAVGSFSVGIHPSNIPEIFVWGCSRPYWRSGPWNGQTLIGVPEMNYLNGFHIIDDQDGNVSVTFEHAYASILWYYVLSPQGTIMEMYSDDSMENWVITWQSHKTECDFYGKCGAFGICNTKNSPICSCLRGYEPRNIEEWSRGNWNGGCVRKRPLQCEMINGSMEEGKADGFIRLTTIKVPDFAEWSVALEDDCKEFCLKNCSCIAYVYYASIGCMSWSRNLIDIQKFSSNGADLYIRVPYSELDKSRDMKATVTVTVIIGVIFIAVCTHFSRRWIPKRRAKKKSKEMLLSDRGDVHLNVSDGKILGHNINLVDFWKLVTATNNFDEANKLGQGGFGSVYRGRLPEGQEIAVKRLSRASAQGLEEFMNEVVVISKLQHRNLVRLVGCCIEGDEKMLIYEYMPKKSLDALLFNRLRQETLDWKKRFSIIEGIGRGLLYLHRDSRLRIIHRDLKASNILLDEDLNPKISDFGMARIFGGNQDQANTIRVVGTYGYMSPEYAMQGRFSERSDVFSFGVLLLEIISGRRNTSFHHDEQSWCLLGYAWKLWNEHNIEALIDGSISEACFQEEILRCIHVGLLCVQEFVRDRPSISTVVSMLCSEIAHLPPPKQPAFTERQIARDTESSEHNQNNCSVDRASITTVQGR